MKKQAGKAIKGFVAAAIIFGGVPVVPSVTESVSAQQVVKDYQNHVYKNQIQYVVQNKLMWLYPDGNFRPEQPITQADLVVGLANVKGIINIAPVPGLPANHWAKVYYERAMKDGILTGVAINPNKVIAREEAAVLMKNAWQNLRAVYKNNRQVYSDVAVNSGWLPKKSGKFSNGVSTTTFDGLGNVTRGELAQALTLLHNDFKEMAVGEKIALQFHNSLKVTGGYLRGQVPVVNGYEAKITAVLKSGKPVQLKSGPVLLNASQIDYMQFNVKKAGTAVSLAKYDYVDMSSLAGNNVR